MSEDKELIPIEQQTLMFYGKPIIVVRLPDGRPGAVIRFFCENMQIDTAGQVQRIQRTEAIADDLVFAQIETPGGRQRMAVLVLHAVPFWLAGIDPKRVREEIRPEILHYQREAVDVLYAWAQSPKASLTNLVPAEQIIRPIAPVNEASLADWRDYHRQMVAWIDWQADVAQWRGSVESRLEGVEAMTGLIPEILERLGPQTLTPRHQQQAKAYVQQLSKATGKHSATIYNDLYTAFSVPRYQDIPESDWEQVEQWFKTQIERSKRK